MSKAPRYEGSSQHVEYASPGDHLLGQPFRSLKEDSEAPMFYSLVNVKQMRPTEDMHQSPENWSMQHHHHREHYDTLPSRPEHERTDLPTPSSISCRQRPPHKPARGSDSSFSSDDSARDYENAGMDAMNMGAMNMGALGSAFLQSLDYDDAMPPPDRETSGAAKSRNDGAAVAEVTTNCQRVVVVVDTRGCPEWLEDLSRFTTTVNAPSKRSKFGGIKSYLAYELTSSSVNAAAISCVWRRYKQFTWLRARLEEKFPAVVVPRLPSTLPSGARYEAECVRRRLGELSLWVEHITGHPALARCEVLHHFMTCRENSEDWKMGKRRAEKDRDVNQRFYLSVDVQCTADVQQAEELAKSLKAFHANAESSMGELRQAMCQAVSQSRDGARRSSERLALALGQLGATFSSLAIPLGSTATAGGGGGGGGGLGRLGDAVVQASTMIGGAGIAAAEHAQTDFEPLNEAVTFYGGLTCGIPELLKLHNSALSRVKDAQKRHAAGRATNDRGNTLLCVCMAEELEVSRAGERIFKRALALFLEGQLSFHRRMVKQLEKCLQACAYD